jgi:hypothetical protein
MDDWGVVAAPRDCLESDAKTRSHSESSAKSSNLCVVFRAHRFSERQVAGRAVDPSAGEVTWMIGE